VPRIGDTVRHAFEQDTYMFAANDVPWVGFDFDGTLAHSETAEPIEKMVDLAKAFLAQGKKVKILTARVASIQSAQHRKQEREFIQKWTRKHIGRQLEVTSEKDHLMLRLYDDRAVQIKRNTGEVVR
jgi:FMN phosphatase YigB (HAD superfamily)